MSGKRCGPYDVLEDLGKGGMADVFSARLNERETAAVKGVQHGIRYALKRLQPKWSFDPQLRAMFESEARLATSLHHPNLVRVYDTGEDLGLPYMVMEYVDGVSCAKVLRKVASDGTRFPAGPALVICAEVLKGLMHAHGAKDASGKPLGIVHRDVSPGNILIGRVGSIKLTDFGIAQSTQIDHHTDPGQVKGKFGYMSPEQVMGEDLDVRSDLFSLGVVLAEMLLGRRLFSGKGEFEVLTRMYEADLAVLDEEAARLEPALLKLLRKALQREREDRFQSAAEFLTAISQVAQELGVQLEEATLVPWLYEVKAIPAQSGLYQVQLDRGHANPREKRPKR